MAAARIQAESGYSGAYFLPLHLMSLRWERLAELEALRVDDVDVAHHAAAIAHVESLAECVSERCGIGRALLRRDLEVIHQLRPLRRGEEAVVLDAVTQHEQVGAESRECDGGEVAECETATEVLLTRQEEVERLRREHECARLTGVATIILGDVVAEENLLVIVGLQAGCARLLRLLSEDAREWRILACLEVVATKAAREEGEELDTDRCIFLRAGRRDSRQQRMIRDGRAPCRGKADSVLARGCVWRTAADAAAEAGTRSAHRILIGLHLRDARTQHFCFATILLLQGNVFRHLARQTSRFGLQRGTIGGELRTELGGERKEHTQQ